MDQVLGALGRIRNRLKHALPKKNLEALWQAQKEQQQRLGFWKSVQNQVKSRRNALMEIGPSLTGPPGEFALIPTPRKRTIPSHKPARSAPVTPSEDLTLPKPLVSIGTEVQARRNDAHFQQEVMRMMDWNSKKMKILVKILNANRARIKKQEEALEDLKEMASASKDKMEDARRASKEDIEEKIHRKEDEEGPPGPRGKLGTPGIPGELWLYIYMEQGLYYTVLSEKVASKFQKDATLDCVANLSGLPGAQGYAGNQGQPGPPGLF